MLSPQVWGKYIWTTIHVVALAYPVEPTKEQRNQYKEFYLSIGNVLPCSKCRNNFTKHLSQLEIDFYLYNRDSLFNWTVELHNIVNVDTGKANWTYQKAYDYYTKAEFSSDIKPCPLTEKINILNMLVFFLILVLISVLFYMFVSKKK